MHALMIELPPVVAWALISGLVFWALMACRKAVVKK